MNKVWLVTGSASGYSRLLWMRFYPRQTLTTLIRGLESALATWPESPVLIAPRTQMMSLRCCAGDGSRPPEIGLQEQVSNRRVLLRHNGRGGERLRKRHPLRGCQVGIKEMSAS